ncbi:YJL206C [Zygosaccharomyces parabailii]|nr:YJL206C [Zygosaccharomyces parabailii]
MNPKVLVLSMDSSTKKLRPKRLRVPHACDNCRSKKKKCDGKRPCKLCKNAEHECVYSDRRRNVMTPEESEELAPLPPRDVAMKLLWESWNRACVLFRFYHRPSIVKILDSFYEPSQGLTEEQAKARPLIYAILAVGALFAKDDLQEGDVTMREFYQDEGERYFVAAKSMLDVTNIDDVYSIQTMFMLTMFLQCSANLKSCYSYMGIALRAAISEGLHRKNSLVGPTPIEDESKKRLFWTVYKVDIYMNCILGLPQSISQKAVNQELPRDLDDENITSEGCLEQSWGKISSTGLNNEHTKLMLVLSKIHDALYPVLQWNETTYANMLSLQSDLDQWLLQLPMQLKPDYNWVDEAEREEYLKPSKLLHMDYLLARILISKPFIHCIAVEAEEAPHYAFQISVAWNCIQVAHEVVHLAQDMIDGNLLISGYWFSVHTIFYSVTCLMFYQHLLDLSLAKSNGMDVQNDCELGVHILMCLKNGSQAGERSFNVLNSIFKEFNRKTTDLSLQVRATVAPQEPMVTPEELKFFNMESDEYLDRLLKDFLPGEMDLESNFLEELET